GGGGGVPGVGGGGGGTRPLLPPAATAEKSASKRSRPNAGLFSAHPRRSSLDHCVGVDQQLPGAGDERRFVLLSSGDQPSVKSDELSVPAKGRRQCCGIEASSQSPSAAFDMASAVLFAAVVIERRQPRERGHLSARDPAALGHAHQDNDRRRQPDPIDAGDQVEPFGKIAVLTDRCHQRLELTPLKLLETGNILAPVALNPLVPTALEAGLKANNVLSDLVDKAQTRSPRGQARVGRGKDLLGCRRGSGGQCRSEFV